MLWGYGIVSRFRREKCRICATCASWVLQLRRAVCSSRNPAIRICIAWCRICAPALLLSCAPIRDATDSMAHHRISPVVVKPVCTPVPPAGCGSVAGDAGFAPPAIALPVRAARLPATSGTTRHFHVFTEPPVRQNLKCPSPKQALRPQLLRLRAKACAYRQAAIRSKFFFASRGAVPSQSPPRGERNRHPRSSATLWERLPSLPGPLPGTNVRCKRLIDSLAFGPGCYSHAPARMIVS